MSSRGPAAESERPRGAERVAAGRTDSPESGSGRSGGARTTPPPPPESLAGTATAREANALSGDDPGCPAATEAGQPEGRTINRFLWFAALPSWLVSIIVHMVLLLTLALWSFAPFIQRYQTILTAARSNEETPVERFQPESLNPVQLQPMSLEPELRVPSELPTTTSKVELTSEPESVAIKLDLDFGEKTAPKNSLLKEIGSMSGSGFAGRGGERKQEMLQRYGGTPGSEAAVSASLNWLVEHQWPDGGWSFDHRNRNCRGQCSDPGHMSARIGATAMALLPFLGAGHTHQSGEYQDTVRRGLYFLTANMRVIGDRGDLSEPATGGEMYSHGLASIVLCESYAMTHDRELMRPAQYALNFIVYAQDPSGGGWRYYPRQAGDTSMVGWQLMALKSGLMAYLKVPRETFLKASQFLDSVQLEYGAVYGYRRPGDRTSEGDMACTAIGLLCRMYLGWEKGHPGLQQGVQLLSDMGPSKDNMYYNYYATQVLRHWEGPAWEKWNSVMRDYLVQSQSNSGHSKGSWYFSSEVLRGDRGAGAGGRLYYTALATMILEVYYRHMPLYGAQAIEDDFPL